MPNRKFKQWRDNAYDMLNETGESMCAATLVKRVVSKRTGKPFKFHPHSNGVCKLLSGDKRFEIVDDEKLGQSGNKYNAKKFRVKRLRRDEE